MPPSNEQTFVIPSTQQIDKPDDTKAQPVHSDKPKRRSLRERVFGSKTSKNKSNPTAVKSTKSPKSNSDGNDGGDDDDSADVKNDNTATGDADSHKESTLISDQEKETPAGKEEEANDEGDGEADAKTSEALYVNDNVGEANVGATNVTEDTGIGKDASQTPSPDFDEEPGLYEDPVLKSKAVLESTSI